MRRSDWCGPDTTLYTTIEFFFFCEKKKEKKKTKIVEIQIILNSEVKNLIW